MNLVQGTFGIFIRFRVTFENLVLGDVSGLDVVVVVQKPDGTRFERKKSTVGDNVSIDSEGVVSYKVKSNDFSQAGEYIAQIVFEDSTTRANARPIKIRVAESLPRAS